MTHLDIARAEKALEELKRPDVMGGLVAYTLGNGQVVIHNLGEVKYRKGLYDTVAAAGNLKLSELNTRIILREVESA